MQRCDSRGLCLPPLTHPEQSPSPDERRPRRAEPSRAAQCVTVRKPVSTRDTWLSPVTAGASSLIIQSALSGNLMVSSFSKILLNVFFLTYLTTIPLEKQIGIVYLPKSQYLTLYPAE